MDIKTTPIVFENGFQVGCPTMHQWDTGQLLLISGLYLPPAVEFHFFNENRAEALRVAGITTAGITTTQVPNELLAEPFNIYAYVYLTDEESSRTGQKLHINITPRPEPEKTSTDPDDPHYVDGLSKVIEDVAELMNRSAILEAASTKTLMVAKRNSTEAITVVVI